MMKFTVNLARRPAENLRRAWVVWGSMLAVLSAILFVLATGAIVGAWNNRRVHRQVSEVEHRMAPLRNREQILDRQFQDPGVRAALSRSQYLNGLIDRKTVSWTRLFERLEKLMPNDLQLISIRPEQKAGSSGIDMIVGSTSLQPAIDFVSRLESAPDFSSAQVVREGRKTGSDQPETQVRVEIEANYQPGDPSIEEPGTDRPATARTRPEQTPAQVEPASRNIAAATPNSSHHRQRRSVQ